MLKAEEDAKKLAKGSAEPKVQGEFTKKVEEKATVKKEDLDKAAEAKRAEFNAVLDATKKVDSRATLNEKREEKTKKLEEVKQSQAALEAAKAEAKAAEAKVKGRNIIYDNAEQAKKRKDDETEKALKAKEAADAATTAAKKKVDELAANHREGESKSPVLLKAEENLKKKETAQSSAETKLSEAKTAQEQATQNLTEKQTAAQQAKDKTRELEIAKAAKEAELQTIAKEKAEAKEEHRKLNPSTVADLRDSAVTAKKDIKQAGVEAATGVKDLGTGVAKLGVAAVAAPLVGTAKVLGAVTTGTKTVLNETTKALQDPKQAAMRLEAATRESRAKAYEGSKKAAKALYDQQSIEKGTKLFREASDSIKSNRREKIAEADLQVLGVALTRAKHHLEDAERKYNRFINRKGFKKNSDADIAEHTKVEEARQKVQEIEEAIEEKKLLKKSLGGGAQPKKRKRCTTLARGYSRSRKRKPKALQRTRKGRRRFTAGDL